MVRNRSTPGPSHDLCVVEIETFHGPELLDQTAPSIGSEDFVQCAIDDISDASVSSTLLGRVQLGII